MKRDLIRRLIALEQRPSPVAIGQEVADALRAMDELDGLDSEPGYYEEVRIAVEQRMVRMLAAGYV